MGNTKRSFWLKNAEENSCWADIVWLKVVAAILQWCYANAPYDNEDNIHFFLLNFTFLFSDTASSVSARLNNGVAY
jgi:hypothetical protein